MANRLYNKQVSPKGYKKGGRVGKMGGGMMMKRPMMQEGGEIKPPKDPNRKRPKALRDLKQKPDRKFLKQKQGKKFFEAKMGNSVKEEPMRDRKKQPLRMGKKMGGSLKPVDPKTQKGLSKLPTEVRNKMGYMKKGGKVHGK